MSLLKLTRECTVTHDAVKSYFFDTGSSCFVKLFFIKDRFVWLSNIVANVKLYFHTMKLKNALSRKNTLRFAVSR